MKKQSSLLPVIICITFILLYPFVSRADNLVKNPGFEASGTKPEGWTIKGPVESMQPVTVIDNKIKFSGGSSLKMESNNPNCHGIAVQTVEINMDQTYLFSARFRGRKYKLYR